MTDLARAALAAVAIAAALAGCAEPAARRDPFAGLRAEAAAAPGPLRPESAGGGALSEPEGGRPPVRGFVRRGGRTGLPALGGDAPAGDGEFTVNFEAADLRDVIRAMLEDGLGLNYVLDPAVTGQVTMRTNRPLTRDEILPTLEEILRLNDAAMVERGGALSIVPGDEIGQAAPVFTAREAAARGLTVRVTPLRFVSVEDVRDVLAAFEPVAGGLTYDPRRDLVFSIGTSEEQRTIAEILQVLDANAFAGRSLALEPLRYGDAEAVAEELTEIFRSPRAGDGPIRFLPIQRLGAILIIADAPGLMEDARALAQSLDQIGAETPRLFVYTVENRDAAELAQVVGGLLGVEVAPGPEIRSGALGPGLAAERTGDEAALDAAAEPAPSVAERRAPSEGAEGVVRIAADENSNAIVALATAAGARRVESALRRLDRQPLQVMLQATLAEVVLNDQLEFGVRWFFESGNWGGGFSDFASGSVGPVFPGFSAVFDTADIRVALSALDQVTDVRLLSSPTLMVLDNETARLQVGDQVPVTTRSAQSVDDPTAPIVTETEFRDTGVILTLRPRVNQNGLVMLDIRQEVSDVVPTGDASNPTFSQRVVESSVAVDSGDTVAIGGLIRESDSRNRAGLPGLSRIPVVGALFGASEFQGARTELIVLLTPQVIRNQRDARAATAELRERLNGVFGEPVKSFPLTGAVRGSLAGGPAGF